MVRSHLKLAGPYRNPTRQTRDYPVHLAEGDTEAQRRAVICSKTYHHEGLKRGCPCSKFLALNCSGLLEGPELAGRVVSTPRTLLP